MTAFGKWSVTTTVMILLAITAVHAEAPTQSSDANPAQNAARVEPQPTAEDVLASLVHHAAVIFAGEVYAIRVPPGTAGAVKGGMPSRRPDSVEIEFRVDMGIRGASIGSNYVLRMPVSEWQQAPPFTLHQKVVTFLTPIDASGFSGPVQGESDLPGMDLGVLPVQSSNQVDISRIQRLVTHKTITTETMPPPADPAHEPAVTDVTTTEGENTLVSGTHQGRMPELRSSTVPFLALLRDISVLSGAETQRQNADANATTK